MFQPITNRQKPINAQPPTDPPRANPAAARPFAVVFLVNTYYRATNISPSSHAVATDGQGSFTIVWSSQAAGIFARRFDAGAASRGQEFHSWNRDLRL